MEHEAVDLNFPKPPYRRMEEMRASVMRLIADATDEETRASLLSLLVEIIEAEKEIQYSNGYNLGRSKIPVQPGENVA